MKSINVVMESVLNIFGFTLSNRRFNSIFSYQDVSDARINQLKSNLDNKSKELIDALVYLAKNKDKKIYKSKNVALYSKFYNMNSLHKLYCRLKYKIPFNLNVLQEVFKYKCGLRFIAQKKLDYLKGKSSITAGAYWGDSSLVIQGLTQGKVYGFEPNKHNFSLFKKMINKNSKQDIIIAIDKGLSNISGIAYINDDTPSTNSNLFATENGRKIAVVSIDEFIEQNNITNLGLIHLDIEGFETKVIEGAKKTIEKYKPILAISIYHNPEDFFDLKPLIENWNLHYDFKIRKLGRNRFEVILICTPKI